MKKIVVLVLVFMLLIGVVGCDNRTNDVYSDYGDTYNSEVFFEEEIVTDPSDKVQYISDRRVQYDEANKRHIVFFGLQDINNNYLSASGVAVIKITDNTNTALFQKSISFTANDFTDWTNQQWDSSRYLCGLYIKDSELQGSASSSGTLSLKVELSNGISFKEETISIYDLPSLSVKVNLPAIPATFKDMRYSSYTSTVQVSKLEYESEVGYDGEASITFKVILKLVSKTGNTNESSTVTVGYKLYDSEGIVVDSGHIYSDPLAVGESSRDEIYVYDLDPRETYTLKFENAS